MHREGRANIAETEVNFTYTLTVCDIYKTNNGTKQPIQNDPGKTEITKQLQLLSSDLVDSGTSAWGGNYRVKVKYSDHYMKFKAVNSISTKAME